jgi:hypothetical protein
MRRAADKGDIEWIYDELTGSGITIPEIVKAAGFKSVEDADAAPRGTLWYPGTPRCLVTKDFTWRNMVRAVPEVWPAQNNQSLRTVVFAILDSFDDTLPWQPVLETLRSAVVWSRPIDRIEDLPRPYPTRVPPDVIAAEGTLRALQQHTITSRNDTLGVCALVFTAALDDGVLHNVCPPASRESIRLTCQAISVGVTLEYTPTR